MSAFWRPALEVIISIVVFIFSLHIDPAHNHTSVIREYVSGLGICFAVGIFSISILDIIHSCKNKLSFRLVKVSLEIQKIQETMVIIPRMAKLKIKEAMDTKIFEEFKIAFPWFSIDSEEYKPFRRDPIIMGITKDRRQFMVCWWDVQKDIDKVKENLEVFKKFKIS